MEAVFSQVKGATEVIPGYMGGTVPNPTHEVVATGSTGHAEIVKIIYDENVVSIEDLLHIFYALHDPSAPSHHCRGIGSQYRPVIFYTEEEDAEATNPENGEHIGVIQRVVEQVQSDIGAPVSTEIMSATEFYAADESHYDYYCRHSEDAYAVTIIEPKLKEIKERFPEKFQ